MRAGYSTEGTHGFHDMQLHCGLSPSFLACAVAFKPIAQTMIVLVRRHCIGGADHWEDKSNWHPGYSGVGRHLFLLMI